MLPKQAGNKVTGCDVNVCPPMSTQLDAQGIELIQDFGPEQAGLQPDFFVIGNVVSRSNPLMEEILTRGVPMNFGISVRLLGQADVVASSFCVIEAEVYDTAFFEKRSKFFYYHAKTAILNNLEYDHADLFPDLVVIATQFHHLVCTVPGVGRLVVNAREPALQRGCWSETGIFGGGQQVWWLYILDNGDFEVSFHSELQGGVQCSLIDEYNRMNTLAAITALSRFGNIKCRMDMCGTVSDVAVYDDFFHHPTAIATTVAGLRKQIDNARILVVLEPRSNTMKLGAMKDALLGNPAEADLLFGYSAKSNGKEALDWNLDEALQSLGDKASAYDDLEHLVVVIVKAAKPGDQVLVMSNGSFGGVHQKILSALSGLQ